MDEYEYLNYLAQENYLRDLEIEVYPLLDEAKELLKAGEEDRASVIEEEANRRRAELGRRWSDREMLVRRMKLRAEYRELYGDRPLPPEPPVDPDEY
jgi:hypothetical protein